MKKIELVEMIREIVKEEVENYLPNILLEVKSIFDNKSEELIKESSSNKTKNNLSKNKPLKKYTNNPLLNEILNETKGGIPQENSPMSMTTQFTDTNGTPVSIEKLPENLSQALTRDYSGLLKAIDKKAKASRQ